MNKNHNILDVIRIDHAEAYESNILNRVSEYGVTIIPAYYNASMLDGLNKEFDRILNNGGKGIKDVGLKIGRGGVIHRQDASVEEFPLTLATFSSAMMEKLSLDFWQCPAIPNEQIYVMEEVCGTDHIAQDLHFDVVATLKFFIYLTDTNENNGAFSCVPGSHAKTHKIREQHRDQISYENRNITLELSFNDEDVVPIEGPAGSLIVFTTEVFHRAGKVKSGCRRVMRGHTRPLNNVKQNNQKKKNSLLHKILNNH